MIQIIADERYVFKPYRENNCDVVEGMVSTIREKSRIYSSEFFEVSGVRFLIPNTSSRIGYSKLVKDGGVINRVGQNVRITYVYNKKLGDDYIIVKIEIAQ